MSYKTLLTVISDIDQAKAPLDQASALAQQFEAHTDALCLGIDRTQTSYDYGMANAMLLQQSLQVARDQAAALQAFAEEHLARNGLPFSATTAVAPLGEVTRHIARRGRFCDLMVVAKPYGDNAAIEGEAIVEAGLFESAAPVLVVPQDTPVLKVPKTVQIGWNESAEALSAVRKAMPFLKAARSVHVVVIDPPRHGPDRSDPGGLLCQMLSRHGIHCEVNVLSKSLPRTADVLLRHAEDTDADLLVMGAYGHSRFREAILGGATRNILEAANRPVLMAH
ncbi:universal stress protein [Epibacterium sp. SM1979]|uniref:Universal stress protein n=1 Tax=Tritonibacter litoralis TaxID=2662264 RepID=A0A843YIA6_9RHOB|nr:universal stress protein [Tritonibacter litoralis]MQQ09174.1 universal stress protein [Tritonibacter litoralis]